MQLMSGNQNYQLTFNDCHHLSIRSIEIVENNQFIICYLHCSYLFVYDFYLHLLNLYSALGQFRVINTTLRIEINFKCYTNPGIYLLVRNNATFDFHLISRHLALN